MKKHQAHVVVVAAPAEAGGARPRRKGVKYNSPSKLDNELDETAALCGEGSVVVVKTFEVPGCNNKKRKANPFDATIIEDAEPTTKKAKKSSKKKGGNISPPAVPSEDQPSHLSDKEELGEQDPDFTIQPGDEVVELGLDETQDEGTQSYPLYSLFLDVVEEINDEDFPPFKVPIMAPFLPLERTELILAWKAGFEEDLITYCQSVDHSSSIIGVKMFAEIMVVLTNQDNYLNKCKVMIRGAKNNVEL